MARNSWLYVADGAAVVSLTCDRQPREFALKGIGILQMDCSCSIQNNSVHLRSTFSEARREGGFSLHYDNDVREPEQNPDVQFTHQFTTT